MPCELYDSAMEYLRRIIDDELDDLFSQVPAIAIDGPKAVGKTTTAEQRARGLLKLDSRSNRASIQADPELVRTRVRPLLIDEWQKVPEVWDVVRRLVDEDRTGGQFLLVGSAAPAPGATAHSGAGRIGRLRMRPMTLSERGVTEPTVSLRGLLSGDRPPLDGSCTLRLGDYTEEILASGFPGLRDLTPRALKFQLDSYLHNAVDRVVQVGVQLELQGAGGQIAQTGESRGEDLFGVVAEAQRARAVQRGAVSGEQTSQADRELRNASLRQSHRAHSEPAYAASA